MTDRDAVIRSLELVRRRWRLRILVEGAAGLAVGVVVALVAWALIERSGLGAESAARLRLLLLAGLGLGAVTVVWRALRARADLATLALYFEEREPSLRQKVISAVHTLRSGDEEVPSSLATRLLDSAQRAVASVDDGRRVDGGRLRRAGSALGVTTLGMVALLALGPASLRTSARTLFDPSREPAVPAPFSIAVSPGDAVVPRGGAQEITARLLGFGSEGAALVFRADSATEWMSIPMERDSTGGFVTRLFDLVRPTEYFVEAEGVRSTQHRLEVADLPAVSGLSALIRFPRYTGLPMETIEEAGDLAVLDGSAVTIRARTTGPTRAAFLVLRGSAPIPMTRDPDGRYSGQFRVAGDGFYRIELETGDGRRYPGSLEFAIDALADRPPVVRFAEPGRDTRVTSVEEVAARIEAADDFGVRTLTLHLSVNGGLEQLVTIVDSTVVPRREVSATHTVFLDEWGLVPGDVVSYYARARDGAGQEGSTDLYFLNVRPFDRAYREAQQPPGGGGGGESTEGLSERQRQLVVGTFNVLRDSVAQSDREWRENVTTLAIGQGRLREEVEALVTRMRQRGVVAGDSTFASIALALDSALAAMRPAEELLGRRRPRAALPDEQRALQHLQRAEAAYRETQVARGGQGGGGEGGQANAEDLADLFELENDRLRNQYEAVQEERAARNEREIDETLERLRRLASRQQQENERMERMAEALRNRGAAGAGGGGGGQRDLARETEEAARQLERLARERNDPSLGESARRLSEAAEAMRRAAAAGGGQGEAQGNQALERLREATRQLERARADGRREELRRLQVRAEELRQRQAEIAGQATSLPREPAARSERAAALGQRKDALARDVEQLEASTDRLAREAAREQPAAGRQLAEAAEGLRENRVRDKILFSKGLLRGGSEEYVRSFEEQIGENLEQTVRQLGQALDRLGERSGAREDRALEQTRELVRGLESLRDRARAAQDQGGRNGRDGQEKERPAGAREGREGGQGQEGGRGEQSGQRGQQGEGRQEGQGGDGSQDAARAQTGRPGQQTGEPRGNLSPGDVRQFGREFRARRQAAESLRADLRQLGVETGDLDRILGEFRALDRPETFGDVRGLDRLEQDLIESLKNLEFSLWRRFTGEGGPRPASGASARVPAQYRDLVEEYYRSLARRRAQQP